FPNLFFDSQHLAKLRFLDLSGSQFLEKIPDLSEIPNIEHLDLCRCTSLVEIDDSIGLLDKLVELNLDGCVNLTRFATRLRLNSLEKLYLSDCKRLESFPEIEVKMESLWWLDISGSGIRELPSSIAYLTGLPELPLLPELYSFTLRGCNLSKSDFALPLVYWYTLTELDLSGNNFVNLPRGFSKFVNLRELRLTDCESLLEIPEQVLPPKVSPVRLDNCTSLQKIPEVSWVLLDNCTSLEKIGSMYLSLTNCVRLRGYYDITENIFLNPRFDYDINLPGDEVPKWFSYCKDATIVRTKRYQYDARCEVSFEIPPNLKWETLRLVLCVVAVAEVSIFNISFTISLNGQRVNEIRLDRIEEGHVRLTCIPLLNRNYVNLSQPLKPGNLCKVEFLLSLYGRVPAIDKIPCGVHLLGHQVADVSVTEDFYQRLLP
ncbi:disease resistance protein RPS6-like, partial [Prunus avium]|uniref:Disease resistance protein RPS6-like n=1 Tax=Prunus avium TaxID=42229 RepID=A0A6P5RG09_PRUAV